MVNLMELTLEETEAWVQSLGEPRFRGKQIYEWVVKGVKDIDSMTNLSKGLRDKIKLCAHTGYLEVVDKLVSALDGTVKYLFRLQDGNMIESVLMEYKHGTTICVSTQVGCKMGCTFCASSVLGFGRNLSSGEILGQVITAGAEAGKKISNVVLMGIGEPLDNYTQVLKFLRAASDPNGLGIGKRHFSLSTCGIVPKIYELMKEGFPLTLSISLHAAKDEERSRIMPVNKSYSIDKLIEVCKIYTKETGRRITFEYALIAEVNDTPDNAKALGRLLKGMLCHVNLIPVNTVEGTGYRKSSRKSTQQFISVLSGYGIEATVRRELGSDINAACGQLRRQYLEDSI